MVGIRQAARAQTEAEIKRIARGQIERDGAAGLSLRAISREIGMVSSAIYRYYSSRDDLLTALIVDSYHAIGAVAETADAACVAAGTDNRQRWVSVAHAARAWACAHPAEYGLLFGTPVPGYAAPPDTIDPARRFTNVLLGILVAADAQGLIAASNTTVPTELNKEFELFRSLVEVPVSNGAILVGLSTWMGLFGAISFEVFGQLNNVIDNRDAMFAAVVDHLADGVVGTLPQRG
jgi:AcrR family transcriptional regulator